jgi:hypothetical protein
VGVNGGGVTAGGGTGSGTQGPQGPQGPQGATGGGSGGFTVAGESGDFSAADNHMYYVDASGGAVNATLPLPTTNGVQVIVKKVDSSANDVTVLPHGAESIDTSSSFVISVQYESNTFIADGSNWWVI